MKISESQIESIVDKVVAGLGVPPKKEAPRPAPTPKTEVIVPQSFGSYGVFPTIEEALKASKRAFEEYKSTSIERRKKIIQAIREILHENIHELARMGRDETGLGRYEDKIVKNRLAIDKTPGVEDVQPRAYMGDDGLSVEELAPFGVIGSITPCTNPSETIICNGIGMIAGGNTVCFNPHPSAKKTSVFTVHLMNKAAMSEGAPPNLFTTISRPTIESAGTLMTHPLTRLLVVTGGPAVVGAAMKSGKRVVAAGPGNPPVVVDETADLDQAARDIVFSASTDNNIICVVEKEIIVVDKVADEFKKLLVKHGGVELSANQARRLEKVIIDGDHPNKDFVGKDIQVILKEIGMNVDASKRLGFAETSKDHPFAQVEMLLPVVPLIRAKDFDHALELAYEMEHNNFHTAVIHSKNIDNMHKMVRKMNTSILVKNGPALAGLGLGGEGPTSFTIASPTGEGLTTARSFCRIRRCVMKDRFGVI